MITRKAEPGDLDELQELFTGTIAAVCKNDYNDTQLRAWISGIENKERWNTILTRQFVIVALDKKKITGFCTLDKGDYLDLLYVHKDYQQQGIAGRLYKEIEQESRRLGKTTLRADVSITARPFFEKMGFKILKEQVVKVRGVEMINYKMIKMI